MNKQRYACEGKYEYSPPTQQSMLHRNSARFVTSITPSGRDGAGTLEKLVLSQSGFKLGMYNISETIVLLATKRGKDKTICPSEVARELSADDWRRHMKNIRKTAFELRDAGKVLIMQKGREVEGNEVVGPIRIKIK